MSRIIKAINAMILNVDKINKVISLDDKYFFEYDNKYKWSIFRDHDGTYHLNYYPEKEQDIQDVVKLVNSKESINYVSYNTRGVASREAIDSFNNLYNIVKEKLLGMDEVLDDIINDGIPF